MNNVQELESVLGPYENWDDETANKISEDENLMKLLNLDTVNELLTRENQIFYPILFDTSIGYRLKLGLSLMIEVNNAESLDKQKELIDKYYAINDSIINLYMDMLFMETEYFKRDRECIKEDIKNLKMYFVCLSTSISIEQLLFELISEYQQLYAENYGVDIVEEVQVDEYDQKVEIFNMRELGLFKELESEI